MDRYESFLNLFPCPSNSATVNETLVEDFNTLFGTDFDLENENSGESHRLEPNKR